MTDLPAPGRMGGWPGWPPHIAGPQAATGRPTGSAAGAGLPRRAL